MLEDEPSELTKMAKFVSGLLPSLNKKAAWQGVQFIGTGQGGAAAR